MPIPGEGSPTDPSALDPAWTEAGDRVPLDEVMPAAATDILPLEVLYRALRDQLLSTDPGEDGHRRREVGNDPEITATTEHHLTDESDTAQAITELVVGKTAVIGIVGPEIESGVTMLYRTDSPMADVLDEQAGRDPGAQDPYRAVFVPPYDAARTVSMSESLALQAAWGALDLGNR